MKVIILTLALIILSIALYSNPITPSLVSEVWFDNNGHFMVEFAPYYAEPFNTSYVTVINDNLELTIPYDTLVTWSAPVVLDLTELLPAMSFHPAGDTLEFSYGDIPYTYMHNWLSWGGSQSYFLTPLQPGQSYANTPDLDFCKDEPPTPLTNLYNPVARDTLKIIITDQYNNPVPNVPIYNLHSDFDFIPLYTDANGVLIDTLYAKPYYIDIKYPGTNITYHAQYHMLEPNVTTILQFTMNITANSDTFVPAAINKGLHAYPTPFNSSKADFITFKYDGDAKLSRDTYIRLYDTKGRFIQQIPMNTKGTTTWKPSADIGSGHYFARLISGNRIYDTTTFTIIK